MAVMRKSMELVAWGAIGMWGTHRAVAWLHEPPSVRNRVTILESAQSQPQRAVEFS